MMQETATATAPAPVSPLLVPMAVQALLVNSHVQSDPDRQFARWGTTYSALNDYEDPLPAAFTESDLPPDLGVHLHWKLPSAYTHGQSATAGSAVTFPFLPNRWMVARLATPPGGGAPALTAWIVQSDYLDPTQGSSNFADPFQSQPGSIVPTMVGRSMPAGQWTGEPGGELFLRATGLADVTFTAYQPGLLDVLAFHDALDGIADGSNLTYWVCGWYSDPTHDILATATPASLDWTVLGDPGAAPTLSVVHGMVRDLTWQTAAVPPVADPNAAAMKVSVGYTAVDALAAILDGGQSGGDIEIALQAFQYGLLEHLDDPDGTAQTELRIRRAWFGSTPGGTLWKIVPVSQGQTTEDPVSSTVITPSPPLVATQTNWLTNLNDLQRQLDEGTRTLRTLQWELFALWWKSQRLPAVIRTQLAEQEGYGIEPAAILTMVQQALDPGQADGALAAVIAQQALVASLTAQLPDPTDPAAIASFSAQIPENAAQLTLKPSALPAFHQPADPVVMVAGMTPPANQIDETNGLACRTLDAAVTGVTVDGTPVTRASGSLATAIALPPVQALPAPVAQAVSALAVEAFFADPANAGVIVADALGAADPGTAATLATAMAAGTAQISTISQPLQAGFAFVPWTQAWSPLFLQWEIVWAPTVAHMPIIAPQPPAAAVSAGHGPRNDNWAFLQSGWTFDGSDGVTARGSEYYSWTGGNIWQSPSGVIPRAYAGRTFLTPHATDVFLARLAKFVQLYPGYPELNTIETLVEAFGQSSILSQTLSGFNQGLLMRGLSQTSPPPAGSAIANAIAAENRGVPAPELGDEDLRFNTGTPFFFPVRGGYFQFSRLVIVDAFGQVLDLIYANGNSEGNAADFQPILGAGLSCDTGGAALGQVWQAPRIVQPARLDLRLLDAADDTKQVYYDAGADPLCGWLLPNHLDRSIMVYDASGAALGELIVLAQAAGEEVSWLPAPDVANPITDPSQIANPHLAAALSAFFGTGGVAGDRVAAFNALYQSIDETLWTVDPPGGQADHDMSALIGRPLAMVRSQLQFELYGKPAVNQSWRDTLQDQDAGLTGFSFPIRLGSTELLDDGLIGYFTADDYTKFNAVHASTAATSPYVAPVVPDNYLSLPFDYPTYTTIELTMLLDPLGKVHAATGLLPTASLTLPPEFYVGALRRMAVTFRVGPALTQSSMIRLPLPAEQNGAWSWIRRSGTGPTDWEVDTIVAANAVPRLADTPPSLIDGWLKFTPTNSLDGKVMMMATTPVLPPLLTYELLTTPQPLEAGGQAQLTLGVSYAGDDLVSCQSIQLTLPVGTDATDLIDGSSTPSVQPATGWKGSASGGVITLTAPEGGSDITSDGLAFTIMTTANGQVGTATLALTENTSDNGGMIQQRSSSFTVDKFPVGFSLSELQTVPFDTGQNVLYGQPAMLQWMATGEGVACTLQYVPADGAPMVNVPVPNVSPAGGFQTEPLTSSTGVNFTLTAKVKVLGREDPMIVQQHCPVTVQGMSISASVVPPEVGVNGLVLLSWNALNADHCQFEDGTVLPVTGSRYMTVTQSHVYTVTAIGGGRAIPAQAAVTVKSSILPTEAGHVIQGAAGSNGANAYYYHPRSTEGFPVYVPPGNGSPGGDADFAGPLPPLDTTGSATRVIPISLTGGQGGSGGNGDGQADGQGGNGGNVSLTATFDPTQSPPAQYIVTLVPGGAGGGIPGSPGTIVTATFAGEPLNLGG
jgi:hypothetical protein